jgi:chitinase
MLIISSMISSQAQQLVGYWHNWNDSRAPYIPIKDIDDRYNVIHIAFALPTSPQNMWIRFDPEGIDAESFKADIADLRAQGKKVCLSVGGATASFDFSTSSQKSDFVSSILALLEYYAFDGLDLNLEFGNPILIQGGTIKQPQSIAQQHFISAVKEIMTAYSAQFNNKMMLTMAPETAYVQGGQSAFGNIWGGYLPILDALRDSLDLLHVQLYNSGSMYGIDRGIYYQGSTDFTVALTEAIIKGFDTNGGYFEGFPAQKIAVGLPACSQAAGGGFMMADSILAAVRYLKGEGPKPGSYTLATPGGYPDLGGMMTWSINWDAVASCGDTYTYAQTYSEAFADPTNSTVDYNDQSLFKVFPNPSSGEFTLMLSGSKTEVTIWDSWGRRIFTKMTQEKVFSIKLSEPGSYMLRIGTGSGIQTSRLIVR